MEIFFKVSFAFSHDFSATILLFSFVLPFTSVPIAIKKIISFESVYDNRSEMFLEKAHRHLLCFV